MTRAHKIALLEAIAKGEAPPEVLDGPKEMPVAYKRNTGHYEVGDRTFTKEEFDAYCAKIERVNRFFPDFKSGPKVVFSATGED